MRDIFADKARARNYDENKADIIAEIKKNVDQSKDNVIDSTSKTDQLLEMMRGIQAQNEDMQKEITQLKQHLLDSKGVMFVE